MNNAKHKREFIRELFLYYKPTLSKEKQVALLKDWIQACIESEEYEMASTLEEELKVIIENPETPVDSTLKVVKIDEIIKKSPKNPENTRFLPEKPVKIPKKTPKKWVFINNWEEPFGFIVLDIQLSWTKKYFKLVLLNYGFGYNV